MTRAWICRESGRFGRVDPIIDHLLPFDLLSSEYRLLYKNLPHKALTAAISGWKWRPFRRQTDCAAFDQYPLALPPQPIPIDPPKLIYQNHARPHQHTPN